jgi:hypothetical protein
MDRARDIKGTGTMNVGVRTRETYENKSIRLELNYVGRSLENVWIQNHNAGFWLELEEFDDLLLLMSLVDKEKTLDDYES